ncbi:MAG: NfeD family protein [Actinomycetales bacterium]|nr:NfeD family protein [Actinomycetales bacterium]
MGWGWLAVAAVAVGIELLVTDLTFLLIGAGALAAAATAALGGPVWAQAVAGIAVAGGGIAFIRPIALRHMRRMPADARTGVDALPGMTGRAASEVTAEAGLMSLRGETWSARLDTAVTRVPVPTGTPLVVTRIDGATALVHPIDELD